MAIVNRRAAALGGGGMFDDAVEVTIVAFMETERDMQVKTLDGPTLTP